MIFSLLPIIAAIRGGVSTLTYSQTVAADGPGAYWKLNETTGVTAADSSGNGHNGVYSGTFTLGAPGIVSSEMYAALSLGGTGQPTQVGSPPAGAGFVGAINNFSPLNYASNFTVEGWVKLSAFPTEAYAVVAIGQNSNTSVGGYQLAVSSTGKLQFIMTDVSIVGTSTGTLSLNAIHHVAVTFDASGNWTFYIDGAASGTGNSSTRFGSGQGGLFLGCTYSTQFAQSNDWYGGVLAHVAVYPTALSAARIAAHYAAGH